MTQYVLRYCVMESLSMKVVIRLSFFSLGAGLNTVPFWPVSLTVRTLDSQSNGRGSIPLRATTKQERGKMLVEPVKENVEVVTQVEKTTGVTMKLSKEQFAELIYHLGQLPWNTKNPLGSNFSYFERFYNEHFGERYYLTIKGINLDRAVLN